MKTVRARWSGVLVLMALALSPGASGGERPGAEYTRALKRFESGRGGSLEDVFESGLAAAREAAARQVAPGAELPGFKPIAEAPLAVVPDTSFFLALAKRRGTEIDERFFTLLRDTYPFGPWRVYVLPRSATESCTRFDSPELVSLYREWTRFWAEHARDYTAPVEREVKALEDAVARSTCACGDAASVERGLSAFLQSFPRAPVAPQVRDRLAKVRAGTSDLRFGCHAD